MNTTETQYALMVDHEDGEKPEIIAAKDIHHADHMARAIYRGRPSWTVARTITNRQPSTWHYVRVDVVLTAEAMPSTDCACDADQTGAGHRIGCPLVVAAIQDLYSADVYT